MTLSAPLLLTLYEKMLLIRECEDRIRREYAGDAMKTPVHLGVGGEAIQAGVLTAAGEGGKVFGTYRNHGIYLALSGDTDGFFGELYGKVTGCAGGKAGSMHLTSPENGLVLTSAVVGTTLPVAVGAAFAHAYLKKNDLVIAFFGDGAVEEGAFWESLNFACLQRLKILFVCEDNGLAIHTGVKDRQGFKSISEAARAFRCEESSAEGHRVENVYSAAAELLKRMENSKMPGFLYAPYYRYMEHVGIHEDYQFKYRSKPDEHILKNLDPIEHFKTLMPAAGITPGQLEPIAVRIQKKIEESVQRAKSAPFPDQAMLGTGESS